MGLILNKTKPQHSTTNKNTNPRHLPAGHLTPFLQALVNTVTGSLDSPMAFALPDWLLTRYMPPRITTKLSFKKIPAK